MSIMQIKMTHFLKIFHKLKVGISIILPIKITSHLVFPSESENMRQHQAVRQAMRNMEM